MGRLPESMWFKIQFIMSVKTGERSEHSEKQGKIRKGTSSSMLSAVQQDKSKETSWRRTPLAISWQLAEQVVEQISVLDVSLVGRAGSVH